VYGWLLFGHLLGVAFVLAGLGAHTVGVERLRYAESLSDVATLLAITERGGRLVLVGGPILVATGLTLAIRYWSLTDGWIATSIVLVIAQGIVGSLVDRRLHELRESFEVRAREVPGRTVRNLGSDRLVQAGTGITVAVIAEILLLMTVKPAGWLILWSVGAMVVVSCVGIWRAWRIARPPRPPQRMP
jgi:uncharacterized membrane protein